ncbi:MAG: hypothetical protein ABR584_07960 [Candidatus Baltobacteraceae bacterium]
MNKTLLSTAVVLAALALTLQAAPAKSVHKIAGGAYQKAAVQGCMNQWLFNGVWRLRVTGVDPITDGSWSGYGVNVQLRNGTHGTVELGNTGVGGRGQNVQLLTSDGNAMTLNDLAYQQLGYRDVVQGGSLNGQFKYHFPAGADTNVKPQKFILQIDPHDSTKAHYSMPDPSFRVNLVCSK